MKVKDFIKNFRELSPNVDFCSVRLHLDEWEALTFRKGHLEPIFSQNDKGYMVNVYHNNSYGYAASADFSKVGIKRTIDLATSYAQMQSMHSLVKYSDIDFPCPEGGFAPPLERPWSQVSLEEKIDLLRQTSERQKIHSHIVDWAASLRWGREKRVYLTNRGGEVEQEYERIVPALSVTAHNGKDTQMRTFTDTQQRGVEFLEMLKFKEAASTLSEEVLELLAAENCPSDVRDILLDPGQMVLQIHESIGHPLELDRILGDERNYAGTTFVTKDMFGKYKYGSEILNVCFDPSHPNQIASYSFDDDGEKAEKQYVIKNGILLRPLGGYISQFRSGFKGVACSRASAWNRPAIDRMSNLNVEPGDSSFDDMVKSTERGVFMKTNRSWSIDDSRNKFQFGCEWGQLIENGELTKVVKNPNYRGISASFWRNLKAVGDRSTYVVSGTPNCGKGEPNQVVYVGHASPSCLFENVEIFGGG